MAGDITRRAASHRPQSWQPHMAPQRHRAQCATAMIMSPWLRKLILTAHVTSSVGWLGAVASFLALAVAALTSQDTQMARSADLAMDWVAWFVIVPLCFVSLLTGLVSSLGTQWGLFRHYWVLVKLLITIPATLVLLLHMQPINLLAAAAAKSPVTLSSSDIHGLRNLLVTAAGATMLVLIVLTALSIYKPRGMTRYGERKQYK
jgi:hypothetical protein